MRRACNSIVVALLLVLVAASAASAGPDPTRGINGGDVLTPFQQLQNAHEAAAINVLRGRKAQVERDPRRMRRLFAPFTARRSLTATVRRNSRAIRSLGKAWIPVTRVWLVVQRWELTRLDGATANVRFIGYESFVRGKFGRIVTPLKRYHMTLHWESRWKTVSQTERWLTAAGPAGKRGDKVHRPGDRELVFYLVDPEDMVTVDGL
jgi:hypothetical protein